MRKYSQGFMVWMLITACLLSGCAQAAPESTPAQPAVQPQATAIPKPTAMPTPPATQTAVPATLTPNPHVAGTDCAKCHTEEHKRWANTLHAARPADMLTNAEHNKAELLSDECLQCHAPFQAARFHIGDFVQPVDQKGPWKVVDKNAAAWQAIQCETCHDPTSQAPKMLAYYNPVKQAYEPVKDSVTLCEKCHRPGTDDSRDLKGSVHEGLQCATCHFQKGTEMSLDPKQACVQCHPAVNPGHPDVATLDTTLLNPDSPHNIHFLTCKTCHPNGTPTPGAPKPAATATP
jgi:uncharacterized lipoprotein YmbA